MPMRSIRPVLWSMRNELGNSHSNNFRGVPSQFICTLLGCSFGGSSIHAGQSRRSLLVSSISASSVIHSPTNPERCRDERPGSFSFHVCVWFIIATLRLCQDDIQSDLLALYDIGRVLPTASRHLLAHG